MKRFFIMIGFVVAVAAVSIILILVLTQDNTMFPMDAGEVGSITFEIEPSGGNNFTVTDRARIEEIISRINDLDLQEPDRESESESEFNPTVTVYQIRCWHDDGSSDVIRIINDDVLSALNEDGNNTYTADCAELLALLDATIWDRRHGVIE